MAGHSNNSVVGHTSGVVVAGGADIIASNLKTQSAQFLAAFSAVGLRRLCGRMSPKKSMRKTMDRPAIAAKADQIKAEVNDIGMLQAITKSGQIALFNQVKRIMNDLCVLIRELADTEIKDVAIDIDITGVEKK